MSIEQPASRFERFSLSAWRQFGTVELDLSKSLTIITGANATGKTTILNVLGQHFNWPIEFLARHKETGGDEEIGEGEQRFVADVRRRLSIADARNPADASRIGSIVYANGSEAEVLAPRALDSIHYSIVFSGRQEIDGLFLSSHRNTSFYRRSQSLPASFATSSVLYEQYRSEMFTKLTGGHTGKSPMMVMKESLLAAAVYGQSSPSMVSNPNAAETWSGFQECLGSLLPESLGFIGLLADPPEIVMRTRTGNFTLDAASGGLSAILELAWQIFLRASGRDVFTVCLDEPENHLHPSMQRSLLPGLMKAFPKVAFIVATHSPFVVSAIEDASIYVLIYGEDGRVGSRRLDFDDNVGAADQVLREVLGVESLLPIWAERKYDEIIARYPTSFSDSTTLLRLVDELREAGLASALPGLFSGISENLRDGDS